MAASNEHAPRLEALSRGLDGLLTGNAGAYEAALKLAQQENDFGSMQTLAILPASLALRKVQFTDPLRSLQIADVAIPALLKFNQRRATADVFGAAKFAENVFGREARFFTAFQKKYKP
jgi:hypothetical protein